jgi:hypothetical protein
VPIVFYFAATGSLDWAKRGIFFAGLFTIAQMSFWGNYMPRVYPTHLRGTGESFAANIGGRMIGTFAAWVTLQLALWVSGATPAHRLALAAATVALVVYVVGFLTSFFLPEPKHEGLWSKETRQGKRKGKREKGAIYHGESGNFTKDCRFCSVASSLSNHIPIPDAPCM